jgi:hypothetical protein
MTTPVAPHNRAAALDSTATEPANESVFPSQSKTSATPSPAGWDPYEVWRTRVFTGPPTGDKKD